MKTLQKILSVPLAVLLGLSAVSPAFADEQIKPIREVFEPAAPANPSNFVKVAVIQWNPFEDAPVGDSPANIKSYLQRNREQMAARIETAAGKGATFIVLSEFAVLGYPDIPELPPEEDEFRNREDVKDFVELVPGPSSQFFGALAKKLGVWIQFGTAEVERGTERYFNTAVVMNDKGQLAASFRKNSLFKLENAFLSAGTQPVVFDSPMGKVGLVICADIYNSRLLNAYRAAGVDVLSLSTSWAQMNTGMSYFQQAARSTKAFVLAANQTYFPDSGVINKDGTNQSHIRQSGDSIAYGYVPKKQTTTPRVAAPRRR